MLRLEMERIDEKGAAQIDGSTRTGVETSREGKVKTVDYKVLLLAFVAGERLTGASGFRRTAKRIAAGRGWLKDGG
jgi:hypothetical protein